ncbi:quercetin 2,3-dioxygenase [Cerasicoccus fimbriatus]|uniref:quercetin 2,3-dioxygenase n=1 Tax=Cerasicoccus fimbriatus TaxID=3014554 RepID=UPI0022B5A03A|nr:quercetin 2,3-dioxygenase [Cerasicoccus sp. TK19100]
MQPIILPSGLGRDFWVWGDRYSFKSTGAETNGAHALLEMNVNPGSGTPPHQHLAEDEMFYVVEGQLTVSVGNEHIVAGPGSYVAVPKGVTHAWANESDDVVKALVFLVPAGFEQFLMRIGEEITDANPTPPPVTDAMIQSAIAIAGDYHMKVVE